LANFVTRLGTLRAMDANKAMKTAVQTARGLAYTTSKFTRIKDWRIAMLHISLSVAIVIGLIFQLIGNKSFLLTEVPLGTVTSWSSASDTQTYTGQKTFNDIQTEWSANNKCNDLVSPRPASRDPPSKIPRS
jgi:hypothetical protein